jgi:caspase domain-containing protein
MPTLSRLSRLIVLSSLWASALLLDAAAPARAQLAPPGQGAIRALVIGIDQYKTLKNLHGAVADARDLAQALKKGGVEPLLLINEKASRREVEAAMNRLVTESRAGDLVFVSFAGHGSQLPEKVKGSDPDGVDEVFVLAGFDSRGAGTAERILDKEINLWLKRLERKGVQTLFLADTCHGGGLTRNVDLRAGELSYRQATISIAPLEDALTPIATEADQTRQPEEFDHLTFLAAVDKWTKAPELKIPGQPTLRGALSYAVARALEGAADRSGDGKTTRRELFEYARQVVQQYSENRQVIVTEPVRRVDLIDGVVFRGAVTSPRPDPGREPEAASDKQIASVRVALMNGAASALAGVEPYAAKIELVGANQEPDLVWDVASGDVVSRAGDVIAHKVGAREIAGVVDRTAALNAIAKISEGRPQRIKVEPNDKHHQHGELVAFRAEGVQGKAVILFNIASDGTVEFLYPIDRDRPIIDTPTLELPLKVRDPYGAEYVVAVVSDRRLPELEAAIKAFDRTHAAGRIPALLRKHLPADQSVRLGSAGLFTIP